MAAQPTDHVLDLVKTRRYCFVIMPYDSLGLMYGHIRGVVEGTTGLQCIRADQVPGSGEPLRAKVHDLIAGAELVIAELSAISANVYYEVGYAAALGKRVLVVCKTQTELPTDLEGLERIQYRDTPSGLSQLDEELREHLASLIDSDFRLLRAMLVAPKGSPSYIFASPRWPTEPAKIPATLEKRTYGDYLGVQGILYALGALLGRDSLPELLSGQHVDEKLLHEDCNVYLIGSHRSNCLVQKAMDMLQEGVRYPWAFREGTTEDESMLAGRTLVGEGGERLAEPAEWTWQVDHSVPVPPKDHGIILRGPHPEHAGRQILVLAGTRSLGTGAACLAATRPEIIAKIHSFQDIDLADKTKTIWVRVSGRPDPRDNHVSPDLVAIEEVGVID